jgi:hypothetical protein
MLKKGFDVDTIIESYRNFHFLNLLRSVKKFTAAGVYLSEGRHPIIPLFHYSIIPVVSAANLSSITGLKRSEIEKLGEIQH